MITEAVRDDFPILKREMMGHPLIYLDSGATALKPQCVIDAVSEYYAVLGANAHRGDYALSAEVDRRFEEARAAVAAFLHAADSREIVFTAGSSASLNQIASGYVRPRLKEGDVILSDVAEHASSVLPFMRAARETGARMEYIELDEHGRITMENVRKAIHDRVRFIVIAQISNVLGQIAPVQDICALAHAQGIEVIVDGAQSAPHLSVDVQQMDCDFFVFSAHKLCGPTGVGVLYGKEELLEPANRCIWAAAATPVSMPAAICSSKRRRFKFESGTPPIEGVLGMKAAIDYLQALGMEDIHAHEQQLRADMIAGMKQMDHVILYNEEADSGIITFNVKNVFAQDAASYFNANGIALRSGQHCAKLLIEFLGTSATLRASLYVYNTKEEVDRFLECWEIARWKTAWISFSEGGERACQI